MDKSLRNQRHLKFAVALWFITLTVYASQPPQAAIASAHPMATMVGMQILKQGGNAFDAAVAVAATLAVVEPFDSGLGGGGFFLLHSAQTNQDSFLDAREMAPSLATATMFQNEKGEVNPTLSLFGPLAAAIPGEPAGLVYIAEHFGHLSLKQDLAPAIQFAKDGFPVTPDYLEKVSSPDILENLQREPGASKIFLQNGHVPALGTFIRQPALAKTLEVIAEHGHAGFYQGNIGKEITRAVNAGGGRWGEHDLANYKTHMRTPLTLSYKGWQVVTAPPPSAGGIAIGEMLGLVSRYDLNSMSDVQRHHILIEAMRLAYWDRDRYLGDPDFVSVPVERMLSIQHFSELQKWIKPNKATMSSELRTDNPPSPFGLRRTQPSSNTTHFSILDKQGNYVAVTLSINLPFGSGFIAGTTGVLLNDHMDDFATKKSAPNAFGLVGSNANQIAPAKRPLSSMSPTFVRNSEQVGILGTPGGSHIPTAILLAILDLTTGHPPLSWVSLPRFHHQYQPDIVDFEKNTLTPELKKELLSMGYKINDSSQTWNNLQAILWNLPNNQVKAASDPRHGGLAWVE